MMQVLWLWDLGIDGGQPIAVGDSRVDVMLGFYN